MVSLLKTRVSTRPPARVSTAMTGSGPCGCAVRYPAEWQQRQEPGERIQATPGKMYGVFPRSWDLEDGGRIEINYPFVFATEDPDAVP